MMPSITQSFSVDHFTLTSEFTMQRTTSLKRTNTLAISKNREGKQANWLDYSCWASCCSSRDILFMAAVELVNE